MSRVFFFFSEAFRALRRNGAPTLAAVITTVVTVVLLGVLIPVFQTAQAKSDEVRGELNVQFALYADATNAEIAAGERKDRGGLRTSTRSPSSPNSEALKTLRSELKDKSIVDELHTNPLPASLQVKATDASHLPADRKGSDGDDRRRQAEPDQPGDLQLLQPPAVDPADRQGDERAEDRAHGDHGALIVASLMLIGNTIRLSIFTRRREVEVMRLVGATRWFIRWPFVIEGVVVGFMGGLVAIIILWIGKITIVDPLSEQRQRLRLAPSTTAPSPSRS